MRTFYKVLDNSSHTILNKYITAYLQSRRNRGYTYYASVLSILRGFNGFLITKEITSPKQITKSIVLEWFTLQKNYKPQGKRQRLSNIYLFLDYLIRIGVIKHNPCNGIIVKGSKYDPHIYSIKEICDILSEAKKIDGRPAPAYTRMLYYTLIYTIYAMGLRINEALNIRLKDIDFQENTIFIYKGKFSKERLLPFSKNTKSKLKSFLKTRLKVYPPKSDNEPIFCNRFQKTYSKSTIETMFRKITIICGLVKPGKNPPRIHCLRHTFAVNWLYKLYNEKKDVLNKLPTLSHYMGHVELSSTQVYLTITDALLREANSRFEDKYGSISKIKNLKSTK